MFLFVKINGVDSAVCIDANMSFCSWFTCQAVNYMIFDSGYHGTYMRCISRA